MLPTTRACAEPARIKDTAARRVQGVEQKRKHSQRQYYTTLLFGEFYKSKRVHKQDTAVMRCSTEEQERHQSVAMEAELLAVETRLSGRPAQEINDTTALTGEQQSTLDKHKVRISILHSFNFASACLNWQEFQLH